MGVANQANQLKLTQTKAKAKQTKSNLKSRQIKHATPKSVNTPPQAKFASGLCFKKLFFIFLIGSVIGAIYEDILIYFLQGEWMLHRGVIYGPFNVIYGFGAVVMCWILLCRKYKDWQIFAIAAVLGGVMEYALSWAQELVTGTVSWDYSHQFLNIQGRTTIPLMLVWGLMGLIMVKLIYPFISNLIEKIPPRIGNWMFWILLIFMIFDCLVSWTAVIRQNLRHRGLQPLTPIGQFCDDYYTDDFLQKYYPNMVRTDE